MDFVQSKHLNPKIKFTIGTFLPLDFTGSKENYNEMPVSGNEEDSMTKGTIQPGRFA